MFFANLRCFLLCFVVVFFWCTKPRRKTRDKTQFPWVQKEPETAIHSPTLLCSLKPSWYESCLRCFMLFVRRGLVKYIYMLYHIHKHKLHSPFLIIFVPKSAPMTAVERRLRRFGQGASMSLCHKQSAKGLHDHACRNRNWLVR